MKKLLLIIGLLTTLFVSCSKDKDSKPTLSINPANIEASNVGETKTITVTTNQSSWKAESKVTWIKVTQKNTTFDVNIEENTTDSQREGDVIVSAGTLKGTLKVKQIAGTNKPTLSISPKEDIKVKADGKNVTLSITTNQADWNFSTSEAAWLSAKKEEGNKLAVSVEKNQTFEAREATITITAGDLKETINVKQDAAESLLSFTPSPLTVSSKESTQYVKVTAPSNTWSIESVSEEWVTAKVTSSNDKIEIKVVENTGDRRAAKIIINHPEVGKAELSVIQNSQSTFVVPIFEPTANAERITQLELARGSEVDELDTDPVTNFTYAFNPKSATVDKIQYRYKGGVLSTISMVLKEGVQLNDEFYQFLIDEGFQLELKGSDDLQQSVYTKQEIDSNGKAYTIRATVVNNPLPEYNIFGPSVVFQFQAGQSGNMPTFSKLPFGWTNFDNMDKDEIIKWETTEGGSKLNNAYTNGADGKYWFSFADENAEGLTDRAYWIDKLEAMVCSKTISKAFYESNGTFFLTKEFKELLNKEGFTKYIGIIRFGHCYVNEADKLAIVVRRWQSKEVNNMNWAIDIAYFPSDYFETSEFAAAQAAAYKEMLLGEDSTIEISARPVSVLQSIFSKK